MYRSLHVKYLSVFYGSRQSKIVTKVLFRAKWYQAVRTADEGNYNTYVVHLRPGNSRLFSTFLNMQSFQGEELLALAQPPT
jgi:hypothetical protein